MGVESFKVEITMVIDGMVRMADVMFIMIELQMVILEVIELVCKCL